MNLNKRVKLSKFNKSLYNAFISNATSGKLEVIDNNVHLESNGVFKNLKIKFYGNLFINNLLPDGYSIKIYDNSGTISIRNLLAKKIKDDNIIFKFSGNFFPQNAQITTFSGEVIDLKIINRNELEVIETSNTNFEDSTLIILEPLEDASLKVKPSLKNGIDDNTITGLSIKNEIDGYSGKVNYHPNEKVFMTGKVLGSGSRPLGRRVTSTANKRVNKIYKKMANQSNRYKETEATLTDLDRVAKPDDENLVMLTNIITSGSNIIQYNEIKDFVRMEQVLEGGKEVAREVSYSDKGANTQIVSRRATEDRK